MTLILTIIGFLAVGLLIAYIISGVSADIAVEKGYDWDKTFNVSIALSIFGLGLFAVLLVKAKPDLRLRERVTKLEQALANQTNQ